MSTQIKVLDCTLRDGGRIFDNSFGDIEIKNIISGLSESKLDYIEVGFLRFKQDITCRCNTTFFESMEEISEFIGDDNSQQYLVLVENSLFDVSMLGDVRYQNIAGIRICVTINDAISAEEKIRYIKNMGYKVFVQCTNTMDWPLDKLSEFINSINEVEPYAFAVVDTYGAMNIKDFNRVLAFVDERLKSNIAIDIHSHNNRQLAFAFACMAIDYLENRECIIDSTLMGMGMGGGNLNTELIAQHINCNHGGMYNLNKLASLIDSTIMKYFDKYRWGYSMSMYAGAEKRISSVYLSCLENYGDALTTEDKCFIVGSSSLNGVLSKMHIANMQKKYNNALQVDGCYEEIKSLLKANSIVVLGRGPEVEQDKELIKSYIKQNQSTVLYVNRHLKNWFEDEHIDELHFIGNRMHYDVYKELNPTDKCICFQDVGVEGEDYLIDYKTLARNMELLSNDSTINALNMLALCGWKEKVVLAGFGGSESNPIVIKTVKRQLDILRNFYDIEFLTKSHYE